MIWHKEQILHLQQLKNQGLTAAKIAETMGVSKQDIYNVTHRQKNKQVPRGFKEGDMVMIQIARGMTTYGMVLNCEARPYLVYRDYSNLPLWKFNKVVDSATGLDWIGEVKIHYV